MSEKRGGGFLRPFGSEEVHPVHERLTESLLETLREQWDALARKVTPSTTRPDHARMTFFGVAKEVDEFVRQWSQIAEKNPPSREPILEATRMAQKSLITLIQEAKGVFEAQERDRIEHQKRRDQIRWRNELDEREQELERAKKQALADAKLQRTQEEIQDIYASIAHSGRVSGDRQRAIWMATHFPQATCACGGFKCAQHIHCFDCAHRFRGLGY